MRIDFSQYISFVVHTLFFKYCPDLRFSKTKQCTNLPPIESASCEKSYDLFTSTCDPRLKSRDDDETETRCFNPLLVRAHRSVIPFTTLLPYGSLPFTCMVMVTNDNSARRMTFYSVSRFDIRTYPYIIPTFDTLVKENFRKHCGKRSK